MDEMKTLTFPDGSEYEIVDQAARDAIAAMDLEKMSYFLVELRTVDHQLVFYHGDEAMDYNALVDKFNDPKWFLYLTYQNLIFIPAFAVEEGAQVLAFSSAWTIQDYGHISRVAIAPDNSVRAEQIDLEKIRNKVASRINARNTDGEHYPSTAALVDYVDAKVGGMNVLIAPESGEVGQYFKISAIDSDGKFVLEAVNIQEGGSFVVPPYPVSNIDIKFNVTDRKVGITFVAPSDYSLNGEMLAEVAGIKVVRKLDSEPVDQDDGIVVADIPRNEMFNYESERLVDNDLVAVDGDNWWYKLFPYSTSGKYNTESVNAVHIEIGAYELYGFVYDQNEANPLASITYIEDNADYSPANMDYATGKFNYGDWGNAWFIKGIKPCMLKYDGTIDYMLDPNDYKKKADGSVSDVTNDAYDGNAMIAIPTVWLKYTDNGDGTTTVLVSDINIDGTYKAYAHTDENGNIMPYTFMPCYNGSVVSNKLRSISGKACMNNQNGTSEISYAKANNLSGSNMWYTELLCDRQLINTLLMLIGRDMNTQRAFGNGHYQGGTSAASLLQTGTMDDKGLFWGSDGDGVGVKVFGMENYYGNQWRRIGGWMMENGTQRIKMTYGSQDGSTTIRYNTTAVGYISIPNSTPIGTSGGFIKKQKSTEFGFIPYEASGSDSTYACDGLWFNNSGLMYARVGGSSGNGLLVGAFFSGLYDPVSAAYWTVGAAISCKPPFLER